MLIIEGCTDEDEPFTKVFNKPRKWCIYLHFLIWLYKTELLSANVYYLEYVDIKIKNKAVSTKVKAFFFPLIQNFDRSDKNLFCSILKQVTFVMNGLDETWMFLGKNKFADENVFLI